jgi:hypothetical protein
MKHSFLKEKLKMLLRLNIRKEFVCMIFLTMLIFSKGTVYSSGAKESDLEPVTISDALANIQEGNRYSVYKQFGLIYNADNNKMYYKNQIVRYFIDRINNGHGIVTMWAYDFDGTIDLYAVRSNTGLYGELIGIEIYSQEDFNLRTLEINAQKNNKPDYNVLTFRLKKEEAPESLQLWIRQCEVDVFDFTVTQQNGRYYIYVRDNTEFGFTINVSGVEANMEIHRIDRAKNDGYALFSVPLYQKFVVSYNGVRKGFVQ